MADRQTQKNLDPMRAGACLLATVTAMREHDDVSCAEMDRRMGRPSGTWARRERNDAGLTLFDFFSACVALDLRASAVVGFAENAFCDDEHAIG
jgi:hypothetical protein